MHGSASSTYDVAILGSGFSGSLLGVILAKLGVRVLLIDAGGHPRFAIGESTIPHTSLLLSVLAEKYGLPELDHLAYPDRLAQHVSSNCGIKRSFGFAYHRPSQPFDSREGLQFGTSSKDENHFFRQDVDAYLFHLALHYGADAAQHTRLGAVTITEDGVTLATEHGDTIRARYVVDGTGHRSVLARQFGLREQPPRLRHHSRGLFTHMIDVAPFEEGRNPLTLSWHQSTLHHVFEGGWGWVIPFNNREGSTNPLTSVGLVLDPRRYPQTDAAPADEFRQFLERFPGIAPSFAHARPVRPWVSTGRIQYSARRGTGYRYSLMAHAYGFVDPLFSRGLINTIEVIYALIDPLMAALADDDFAPARFAHLDALQAQILAYNDALVDGAFIATADFDLWNAWLRVWALGTIITEFRLMNALTDFTGTHDEQVLQPVAAQPAFSNFEAPAYATFFAEAVRVIRRVEAGTCAPGEAARQLFALAAHADIDVPIRRDAMRRAGWLRPEDIMSDRNVAFARDGYRWAISNPDSRDLFGTAQTFYRWRARHPDPHLTVDPANRPKVTEVPQPGPAHRPAV